MSNKTYKVIGIGNAIVDVIANVDDQFISQNNLNKGSMKLVSKDEAKKLYQSIKVLDQISGGSAANTVAGLAMFGSKTGFIGKVNNDDLGAVFKNGLNSLNIDFQLEKTSSASATGQCLVLITPDAERTMNTYLGISAELNENDINTALIEKSSITYLEGYLWDPESAKNAMRKAINIAHQYDGKVAFSLSDKFCVVRHHEDFRKLVENEIDILFANEDETKALVQTNDFNSIIEFFKNRKPLTIITRGEKGSCIINKQDVHSIAAQKANKVLDTTGAGDLYAAGFLHGLCKELPLQECGRLGSIAAAEIISHYGARPEKIAEEFQE